MVDQIKRADRAIAKSVVLRVKSRAAQLKAQAARRKAAAASTTGHKR